MFSVELKNHSRKTSSFSSPDGHFLSDSHPSTRRTARFEIMLLFIFVTGLLSETLCSSTFEAEPGDSVTVWCHHELDHAGYIFWFYQNLTASSLSATSAPRLIGCKHFKTSGPPNNCYFITENERLKISVDGKNTSLTIAAVNESDTGLYYCSYMQLNHISFGHSSYLRVKAVDILPSAARDSVSSAVFFILNVVFGAVVVILLIVLIIIAVKHKNTVDNADTDQDHDSVNYGPVKQLSRKTKGRGQIKDLQYVYTHVVYQKLA
ncbi:uncharacterized protein LOC124380969 isoform X2 [Silurus meridionalis]|uniref:uncharacterized protein LOC124380969 isoform X2 n=1 Tax=Silurus meridionalis TaxID=175797 RepID=UPI001EE9DF9C|nr:uncharacterized protein LOC124380969 isoform X2 [Silurus meridionalis]